MSDTRDTSDVEDVEPVELAPIEPETIYPVDPNVVKADPNAEVAEPLDDESETARRRRSRSE